MVKSVLLKDYCFSNCCYLSCIRQYKVVNFDYIPSNLLHHKKRWLYMYVVGNIILYFWIFLWVVVVVQKVGEGQSGF